MPIRWDFREHAALVRYSVKWMAISLPVAAVTGTLCAGFLVSLDWATALRWAHPWLLFLLPAAGVFTALLYHHWGKRSDGGNNLIMDQIHKPGMQGDGVPWRMAPLVLVCSVITHLFGGSAGREGTAVQSGGAVAAGFARLFRLPVRDVRILLTVGIAAGFAGIFGTPIAGTVFAVEVLTIGAISYEAIVPCLMGALAADWTCSAWGVQHTDYHRQMIMDFGRFDPVLVGKCAAAAVGFGVCSFVFAELTHGLTWTWKALVRAYWLRPVAAAALVIGLTYLLGTRDYLGLGVNAPPGDPHAVTILSAFTAGGATRWSWFWKILFTAVTLSGGFKGGEVTPLFFIGATLGNVLAWVLHAPVDLFAALGFVAVFAGATNTPLACTIMGIELFGAAPAIYLAVACFVAYLFSGHSGIYLSQRVGTAKVGEAAGTLRGIREGRGGLGALWRGRRG